MYTIRFLSGAQALPCMYLNHLEGLDSRASWVPRPGAEDAAGLGHILRTHGINRFHNLTVLSLWFTFIETLCHTLLINSKFEREIQI